MGRVQSRVLEQEGQYLEMQYQDKQVAFRLVSEHDGFWHGGWSIRNLRHE